MAKETLAEKEINKTIKSPTGKIDSFGGLTKDELMNALRLMILSRTIDHKVMNLIKQGKAHFHIAGAGHEAIQVACGLAMKKRIDWAFPYYRDMCFSLTVGVKPEDVLLSFLAKEDDPFTGGRQMPCHWASKEFNIPTQSSPTGTQFLQAVGAALSLRKQGINGVVYASSGEGTTSEGEFHEAVNWAAREKLPVVFVIQNNKWAISVPVENQTAGKNASVLEMMKGYENLLRLEVDGTDFLQSHAIAQSAFKYARNGNGPVLIEAHVVRLFSHSSSDDQKKYRPQDSLQKDLQKDPIELFSNLLIKKEILTEQSLNEFKKEIQNHVNEAADWALKQPDPKAESAVRFVLDESGKRESLEYEKLTNEGKPIVMVDAINHALREEMQRNDKIYLFGEDVADGKGGVFSATKGLSTLFGNERVFNSPLAEASIVGTAVGMALTGLKPCVEIQFGDYIWPAFMQFRDEMVMYRYRSNNLFEAPVVTRVAVGGFIHGGLYHSQNIEGFFAHMPGLLIAYPSNAADAKGLLKTALRINDPVLFLEHKGLYRQSYATTKEPDADYLVPFGKAKIVNQGNDLTIVTYGAMVHESNFAIKKLEQEGYSIELIDIRTIAPLDFETIKNSVKKTGKVIVVHEDTLTAGFGAEISAQIAEHCFEYLDAPVKRVAALDAPIPFHPILENTVLPNRNRLYNELKSLLEY
ncbi:MAG: dehydrogenase E1 component subunit alpha/beta [Ignavibacteriales bacterium]|uniref:Dehydrogenase E1 component subunit alpha/beta n=1 Tax=Stygiobacter electus TaxID=3032292 RepID=A0AAE3NY68_9BACT|nr:dehydrogenase E1 component subunit alpha/beta [Stygiobacter electus]MBI5809552.1 dehydrogenase E1 component subunit alpha/beta [Ignavibacteriales bacterium]MDF1610629.1 dehydrogenase E1 component subunit alpha/beta [Stygiobacter electus]